jgi:hypothetical protein
MAVAHWRLLRVWGMEKATLSRRHEDIDVPEPEDAAARDALVLGRSKIHMNEYEMSFDRQFTRALHEFEKFRAARTRQIQQTKVPEVVL